MTMTYHSPRVSAVRRLTPLMTRITFGAESLRTFTGTGPDQYVKLFFPLPGQARPQLPPPVEDGEVLSWYRTYLAMPDDTRPPMRTYTIRAERPAAAEVDIDFVLHPTDSGPASAWAASASPGDEIALLTPSHALYSVPADTHWQLLVGDETTVPAVGAIVESLPSDAVVRAFVEVAGPEEEQDFSTSAKDLEITWVHRNGDPRGSALLDVLRAAEFPDGSPYAWISGEASLVKYARRHLVRERSVDKRAITFTGYWRQGRSEEEIGRESVRAAEAGEAPPSDD